VELLEDGLEQGGLRREVVIERPGGDPRLASEVLHAGRREPSITEAPPPGVDQGRARLAHLLGP
jgi:hypothetical protein